MSGVLPWIVSQQGLSNIGLGLDIVGAVLLWRFGIPRDIDPSGRVYIATADLDQGEIVAGRRFRRLERSGIGFLIVGFVLQLAANWVAD